MDLLDVFFNNFDEFVTNSGLGISGKHYSYPKLNAYLDKDWVVIEASVPGVKKEDITVKLEAENKLVISIKKQKRRNDYIFQEIPSRETARLIQTKLPIDKNSFKTKLENGILTIKFKYYQDKEQIIPID